MGLGKVYDIDVVADAGTVGGVVVVTEYAQFLADADCGLGEVRDEVLRNTVGELADFSRRVCPDGVEVTEDDALERRAGVDDIGDDFF